jgi:2-phospho-L-lactate guanylyltransferase
MMDIWAVIPVKPLSDVKRRLAGVLAAEERAQLIQHFLRHELEVLGQTAAVRPLIVSSDLAVASLARGYGAEILLEEEADGLNTAVARGVAQATAAGASGVLVLPVDLPFLTTEDICRLLQTVHIGQNGYTQAGYTTPAGWRPAMAMCADKSGEGTNALFFVPPVEFTFQFGPGSFRRHLAEAAYRGLTCHILSAPGLAFDLDTEADWRLYMERLETGDW